MIIRMTVKDNDYTDDINQFSHNLFCKFLDEEVSFDEIRALQRAFRSNADDKPVKEDIELLHKYVKIAFERYISNIKPEVATYLIRKFEVSTTSGMVDKWENGEVAYYFTSSDACIIQ